MIDDFEKHRELIKDLLWTRNYHMMLIKEIDTKLMKISKKHGITIPIDG